MCQGDLNEILYSWVWPGQCSRLGSKPVDGISVSLKVIIIILIIKIHLLRLGQIHASDFSPLKTERTVLGCISTKRQFEQQPPSLPPRTFLPSHQGSQSFINFLHLPPHQSLPFPSHVDAWISPSTCRSKPRKNCEMHCPKSNVMFPGPSNLHQGPRLLSILTHWP